MSKNIKLLICISGIIFFVWFLIPVFLNIINIGNVTGIIISVMIILTGCFGDKALKIFRRFTKVLPLKIISIIILAIITAAAFFTVILSAGMIYYSVNVPQDYMDSTLIVLGCKVNGETPSIMLEGRLNSAYKYLAEHPNTVCILSGGQGNDEYITEAEAMKRYLVSKGIDEDRLIKEEKSINTDENIRFSKQIIEENSLPNNIVIATDGFHQMRAGITADKYGLTPYSASSVTVWYLFPTYYVRELYGLMKYIFIM